MGHPEDCDLRKKYGGNRAIFKEDTLGKDNFLQRRAPKILAWKSSLNLSPSRQHKAGIFSKGALIQGLPCPRSLPVPHVLVCWVLHSERMLGKGKKKIILLAAHRGALRDTPQGCTKRTGASCPALPDHRITHMRPSQEQSAT